MFRETMTDGEIEIAAQTEWLEVLVRMWDAVDKKVDAKRLKQYRRELESLPLGLLDLAVSRCIRENTFTSVPSVGKIWEAVRKELGNPFDLDAAIETWQKKRWQSCFNRCEG